jgi:hypothetical protein
MIGFLWAFLGAVFGAGGALATQRIKIAKAQADVNGLGRKYWKSVACDLRCVAEETPISKGKLMHLADLIDPK